MEGHPKDSRPRGRESLGTPSGWSYTQVVQGGESFVALSEGLQNALAACGGVPSELRTDRLSAACRNRNGSFSADITRRYHALCSHYGLSYSRNNLGVAHENGCVESPHGHLKRRIEQAARCQLLRRVASIT